MGARTHRDFIQEKARNARYQLMLDYAREENIDTILTAHTSDDNIETFIMRLAKGRGLMDLNQLMKFDTRMEFR